MSFYIGGELDIDRITRDSFGEAASEIGISKNLVFKHFDDMANKIEKSLGDAADDLASKGFENAISKRDAILESSKNRLA